MTARVLLVILALQGCSSRPREFTPTVGAAASDQSVFKADYATCRDLLAQGKLNESGRLASGAAGVAAGATTAVLGSAAATSAGLYGGGVALASATVVLLPFAVIGGAVGMAKMKRHRKELAVQRVMNGCLAERGHTVSGWTKKPKQSTAKKPL
jgi:hypothetical protein